MRIQRTFSKTWENIKTPEERTAKANELKEANVKLKEDEYKYAIKCQKCGAQWKYKRWGKILSNPSNYKCGCGGELKAISLDGSREVWAANKVK